MTDRDAFEAWYLAVVGDWLQWEPVHEYYLDDTADDMWQAWQAAVKWAKEAK